LAIAAIVTGSCGSRIPLAAEAGKSVTQTQEAPDEKLTSEDLDLLRNLDLLLELELLQEWDPEEDLPIPIEAPEAPDPDGEKP
jgi:hypothetical protein